MGQDRGELCRYCVWCGMYLAAFVPHCLPSFICHAATLPACAPPEIAHRCRRVRLNNRRGAGGRPSGLAVSVLRHRRRRRRCTIAPAVPNGAGSLRDEALSWRERAGVGPVRGDCFGGNAAAGGDRAVAVQAPLSAGVDGGPAGSAEGVVASGAPLDRHLRECVWFGMGVEGRVYSWWLLCCFWEP